MFLSLSGMQRMFGPMSDPPGLGAVARERAQARQIIDISAAVDEAERIARPLVAVGR
jgi:hypothetical protein